MMEIKCSIETQGLECLLTIAEIDCQKTDACLMKISNVGSGKVNGEKLEGIGGKIIKGRIEIYNQAQINIKEDPIHSVTIIEITPR